MCFSCEKTENKPFYSEDDREEIPARRKNIRKEGGSNETNDNRKL